MAKRARLLSLCLIDRGPSNSHLDAFVAINLSDSKTPGRKPIEIPHSLLLLEEPGVGGKVQGPERINLCFPAASTTSRTVKCRVWTTNYPPSGSTFGGGGPPHRNKSERLTAQDGASAIAESAEAILVRLVPLISGTKLLVQWPMIVSTSRPRRDLARPRCNRMFGRPTAHRFLVCVITSGLTGLSRPNPNVWLRTLESGETSRIGGWDSPCLIASTIDLR
jgi:hypothetical protein